MKTMTKVQISTLLSRAAAHKKEALNLPADSHAGSIHEGMAAGFYISALILTQKDAAELPTLKEYIKNPEEVFATLTK